MVQFIRICFFIIGFITSLNAQTEQAERIAKIVYMDAVEIKAFKNELSIDTLIGLIIEDTTFYEAFRRIKKSPLHMNVALKIFNRKNIPVDSARYSLRQHTKGNCRWMESLHDYETSGMRKRQKHRYYTSNLLESIFITRDTSCWKEQVTANAKPSKTQKHIDELKKLMFQPGVPVNVPLMGNKSAIFEADMQQFYDYQLRADSIVPDHWIFTATVKPDWISRPHKTVIKNLEVVIHRETHEIVRKKYHLNYRTVAYQFDVHIDAQLEKFPIGYLPSSILYEGHWNAATKKSERAEFQINIY